MRRLSSILYSVGPVITMAIGAMHFFGSAEVLAFFLFLVATWAGRVVITLVIPWPTSLQMWLVTAFATQFLILLVPAWYLWSNRHDLRRRETAAPWPSAD